MGKIILRLDRVMADRKMSLKELSEKVGVSNVNLSKMKTGKISAIRFSTLEAMCEAVKCHPGDILESVKDDEKSELLALFIYIYHLFLTSRSIKTVILFITIFSLYRFYMRLKCYN